MYEVKRETVVFVLFRAVNRSRCICSAVSLAADGYRRRSLGNAASLIDCLPEYASASPHGARICLSYICVIRMTNKINKVYTHGERDCSHCDMNAGSFAKKKKNNNIHISERRALSLMRFNAVDICTRNVFIVSNFVVFV